MNFWYACFIGEKYGGALEDSWQCFWIKSFSLTKKKEKTKDKEIHVAPECASTLIVRISLQNYIKEISLSVDKGQL